MGQLCGEVTVQLGLTESPAPVAAMQAGSIHAGLTAQAKHLLQRNNAEVRGGALRGPDKGPMNAVFASPHIGLSIPPLVFCGTGIPPAGNGVVVVSSRVAGVALS